MESALAAYVPGPNGGTGGGGGTGGQPPGGGGGVYTPPQGTGVVEIFCLRGINESLPEADEQGDGKPGWYVPADWADADNDGWTSGLNAIFTPDKSDTWIKSGSVHLRQFNITMTNGGPGNYGLVLTYDTTKLTVYGTTTKTWGDPNNPNLPGKSSIVPSGTYFKYTDLFGYDNNVSIGRTLYAEGKTGSTAFKDAFLKAELRGTPPIQFSKKVDDVQVSVFEATQTGIFSGLQQADDDAKFNQPNVKMSSNKNGIISWDTWNGVAGDPNCQYFHDCMEMQATVKPPRPGSGYLPYWYDGGGENGTTPQPPWPEQTIYLATFDMQRQINYATWNYKNGQWNPVYSPQNPQHRVWGPDNSAIKVDKDLTISAQNHIYFVDAPGLIKKDIVTVGQYYQSYNNFLNHVVVKLYGVQYACAAPEKWHNQMVIKPKNATDLTRHSPFIQKLGPGWITVPQAANDDWRN